MRRGLSLIGLAALTACEEPKPLFIAECGDGSRIAGAKDVVESRCARRGGVSSRTPLDGANEPPAQNGQAAASPPGN